MTLLPDTLRRAVRPEEPSTSGRAPGRVVVAGLSHRYRSRSGDVVALECVDLTIEPGEFVCIVGPSGCGKTTLLRAIAGFLRPSSGSVLLDGVPITGPGPERGVVFQQPTLLPWLTVRGNVELGPRLLGADRTEARERAYRHLELVGLADFADHRVWELSGGMQQRCAIARALANDPEIVLMDEPFGALDALTRERLQQELLRIWMTTRKSIVFITHSVEEAIVLGTRIVVMAPRPGRIVLDEHISLAQREAGTDPRLTPGFAELRARVTATILAADG